MDNIKDVTNSPEDWEDFWNSEYDDVTYTNQEKEQLLNTKSKYYEEFMKSAVASDASVEAAEFFKGVTVDKSSGKLSFLCTNAPTLCARLTQQSHRQDALEFKHGDSSIFIYYTGHF